MVNRIKDTGDEDVLEPEVEETSETGSGRLSLKRLDGYMRFLVFLVGIGLLYIANTHIAEKQIRKKDQLIDEIRELKADYITLNEAFSSGTKQSVIAQKVDTLGLAVLTEPMYKLKTADE